MSFTLSSEYYEKRIRNLKEAIAVATKTIENSSNNKIKILYKTQLDSYRKSLHKAQVEFDSWKRKNKHR